MADAFRDGDAILSLKDFEERLRSKHDFEPLLQFLDGLSAGEARLRHDRVAASHLVLLTFMNRFGYDFQKYDEAALVAVVGKCKTQVVANLVTMIRRMELADDVEFGRLIRLVDRSRSTASSAHRVS